MAVALLPRRAVARSSCAHEAFRLKERRTAAASAGWASPGRRGEARSQPSLRQRHQHISLGRWQMAGNRRRGPGLQCQAAAAPAVGGALALLARFPGFSLDFLASALGYIMGGGSLLLFAPIIINLVKAKSAQGMSVSTWLLQLAAFAGSTLYNLSRGHPFSTFAESACLGVQSLFILLLILYYQDQLDAKAISAVVLFLALCALALWLLPAVAWTPVQVISSVTGVGALLPQILLNHRQGSTGEWSAITAGLSSAGNGLRVFTTVQLTGDPILMVGFTAGFLVNLTLFCQILYYASKRRAAGAGATGRGLAETQQQERQQQVE